MDENSKTEQVASYVLSGCALLYDWTDKMTSFIWLDNHGLIELSWSDVATKPLIEQEILPD